MRRLAVVRVADLTPGLRRITLGGPQLAAFTADGVANAGFVSTGFDDDIRLLFPYPGESEPVLPVLVDGQVTFAAGRRPLARTYTVRGFDAAAGELDVDVVLHGAGGEEGIAGAWARGVRPGDPMHIAGPRACKALPPVAPLLVVGDETALPAVARLMGELPPRARVRVLLDVADAAHALDLRPPPGVEVTWHVHDQAVGDRLLPALESALAELPPAETYAWIAGEQGFVRAARRSVVAGGVPRARIDFTGYWRVGVAGTPGPDPAADDASDTSVAGTPVAPGPDPAAEDAVDTSAAGTPVAPGPDPAAEDAVDTSAAGTPGRDPAVTDTADTSAAGTPGPDPAPDDADVASAAGS